MEVMLCLQELEVLSLSHLYSLKTKVSQCQIRSDIMRFSVKGSRSDKMIELQSPVLCHRETIKLKEYYYGEIKKNALNPQIVRAKKPSSSKTVLSGRIE